MTYIFYIFYFKVPVLTSIGTGFNNLAGSGEDFEIRGNTQLNLIDFSSLNQVEGTITVEDTLLTSLDLQALTEVGPIRIAIAKNRLDDNNEKISI